MKTFISFEEGAVLSSHEMADSMLLRIILCDLRLAPDNTMVNCEIVLIFLVFRYLTDFENKVKRGGGYRKNRKCYSGI